MRMTICEPMGYDLTGYRGPRIFADLLNQKIESIESRATDTCVLKILQMPEGSRRWLKREVSEGESKGEDNKKPKKKARRPGSTQAPDQAQKKALQKWKEDKKGGLLIYDTINVEYDKSVRGLKMDARQKYDRKQQKIELKLDDWDFIVQGLKWDRHWIMTFIYSPKPPQLRFN